MRRWMAAVTNARLLGHDGLQDLLIDSNGVLGQIRAAGGRSGAATVVDAAQSLVLPGFVDAHVHLDKALLNARCCAATGSFSEALEKTLEARRGFTVEDVRSRATRVLEAAIAFGTTKMRTHCDVGDGTGRGTLGLDSVEALLELKRDYAWAVDLQVAAFAQEGFTHSEGAAALLRTAVAMGCDVVGSAPYTDAAPAQNIAAIFALAREYDVAVDFHLDYHLGDEKPSYLQAVLEQTVAHSYQRRVCLGHCTALSSLPPAALAEVAAELRAAGVAVLALPASDVYMQARADEHDKRRGVAPVDRLRGLGVAAAFATNNVQNLFTFTGDGDVLKVGTLTAQMLQLGARSQHADLLRMATTGAAEAIGCPRHEVAVGLPADLVVLHGCENATDALAAPPVERTVLKRGRVVARTCQTVELFPPTGDMPHKRATL